VRRTKKESAGYAANLEAIRKKLEKRKPKSGSTERRDKTDSQP
jgi:hypothetical protein